MAQHDGLANSRDDQDQKVKSAVEARQGETSGRMRWVLAISLLLAVLIIGGLYLAFMR
jgi:hypothetical protein